MERLLQCSLLSQRKRSEKISESFCHSGPSSGLSQMLSEAQTECGSSSSGVTSSRPSLDSCPNGWLPVLDWEIFEDPEGGYSGAEFGLGGGLSGVECHMASLLMLQFSPGELSSVTWRLGVIPGDLQPTTEVGNPWQAP